MLRYCVISVIENYVKVCLCAILIPVQHLAFLRLSEDSTRWDLWASSVKLYVSSWWLFGLISNWTFKNQAEMCCWIKHLIYLMVNFDQLQLMSLRRLDLIWNSKCVTPFSKARLQNCPLVTSSVLQQDFIHIQMSSKESPSNSTLVS